MNEHPILSILYNKYNNLYNNLSNKIHIIILPETNLLLNIDINLDFIKKHIFLKSYLRNTYINLNDQCIEIESSYILTSYGFEKTIKCKILKEEINYYSKFLKAIFTDKPLEGNYEENILFSNYTNVRTINKTNIDRNYKNILNDFFTKNKKCKEYYFNNICDFIYSYIIVTGFETYIGKKIVNVGNETLKLQNNLNEKMFNEIRNALIKYTYCNLYKIIWNHLITKYEKLENKIQKKMRYLKENIDTFLEKLNMQKFDILKIETVAFHINQIEKCNNPIDKIYILDYISKIICELYSYDKNNNKISIYDIDSDSLIVIFSTAIAFSQIKNIISHSIHLHMYIDNLSKAEKIDKLSFIFTIFHSSIIYICDLKKK